ncbi:MAG: hypothetical protein F6J99_07355 [Moorea sp. SIO4G3]|nr:hypothetical protein [Moorena sp. SIO4G3]
MQLEEYFNFLAPDDIRIKGHRIGIETVLYEYLFKRCSAFMRGFPPLALCMADKDALLKKLPKSTQL